MNIDELNKMTVGGTHWNETSDNDLQYWDYAPYNRLGCLEFTAGKYVLRYKNKNGLEDLIKARTYILKMIQLGPLYINTSQPVPNYHPFSLKRYLEVYRIEGTLQGEFAEIMQNWENESHLKRALKIIDELEKEF